MKSLRETAQQAKVAAKNECTYWEVHFSDLVSQFPDHFVAIHPETGEVLVAKESFDAVLHQLAQQAIRPNEVWVRFLTTRRRNLQCV